METIQRGGYVRIVGHLNPRCWLMKLLVNWYELENVGLDLREGDYANFPINNSYIPMVERCSCPFFVVNEFLYQGFSSGLDIKYFLLHDYRLASSKLAKELRRSIDALKDCLDGTMDLLIQIEMLSWAGVMPSAEPIWSVMKAVNEIAELLPKVQAAAKYRAGPAGNLIRRSIFLSMAMAWEELTGRPPAKNNAKFQDLANAAYWTVVPSDENYSTDVAAATAIEALKRSKKAAANSKGYTQRWLPKPWKANYPAKMRAD